MANNYQYGQFGPEHLKKIEKGILLYNQQKFWECHEELEDPWIEDIADNARLVYWAVIQVATSLYHYEDGNLAGAIGMLNKAREKFQLGINKKVETDLLLNNLSWNKFKQLVFKIPERGAQLKDFSELYEFRFNAPETWTLT